MRVLSSFRPLAVSPCRFEVLVDAFDKIEQAKASGTGSNKKQTVILTNLFRILIYYAPSVLVKAVYICLNKVAPDYLGKEVGVGESLILKAMAETYGRTEANLKKGNGQNTGQKERTRRSVQSDT